MRTDIGRGQGLAEMLSANDQLGTLETLLRNLIRSRYADKWFERCHGKIVLKNLAARQRKESHGRRGLVEGSGDLLDSTDFRQVADLILDNWDDFQDVLGEEVYGRAYLERLKVLRNKTMHGKPLSPFEFHLISGMVGELEQLITIHRSQQGPDMQYYPIILTARDSYGHDDSKIGTADGGFQISTGLQLFIGQTVSFHLEAIDPSDRELTWQASVRAMGFGPPIRQIGEFAGNILDFSWTAEPSDVGKWAGVWISVKSSGEFHRERQYDDKRAFWYEVHPERHEAEEVVHDTEGS